MFYGIFNLCLPQTNLHRTSLLKHCLVESNKAKFLDFHDSNKILSLLFCKINQPFLFYSFYRALTSQMSFFRNPFSHSSENAIKLIPISYGVPTQFLDFASDRRIARLRSPPGFQTFSIKASIAINFQSDSTI